MSNEYIWIDSDPEVFRFIPGHDDKPWNNSELGYRKAEGYDLLDGKRVEMPMLSFEEKASNNVLNAF